MTEHPQTRSAAAGGAAPVDPAAVEALRRKAARCRRLARGLHDRRACDTLLALSRELEARAAASGDTVRGATGPTTDREPSNSH
jgi:hypothetical protein